LRFEPYLKNKVTLGRDVEGYQHVNFAGQNAIGRGVVFTGQLKMGYGTTVSANSYFIGHIEIGNYCQIGANVGVLAKDHPIFFLSTYINQNLFSGSLHSHEESSKVVIGHDVWIGQGAIILRGATIGNGAVIGAGAVVTKPVSDFAIAVGNPARTIKKRFSDDVCELINATEWWLKSTEELRSHENLFHINSAEYPDDFKNALRAILGKK
jgi:acetyltransferase-like isoleucine patch superfamily enzyme